ncbi:MAG: hypothetical protein ACXABG_02585 [Promethearchaeota archaeon]|jgi:hypothetical protein
MSYIEKKYNTKISEVFDELTTIEQDILKFFMFKSTKNSEKVAKLCALSNRKINLILKKYYPEIKEINDKLRIKSRLKFYYDLIDKLTHYIRCVEEFQKLDDQYYDAIIDFIEEKELLINGKYRDICSHELTVFYDKNSREELERVLEEKIEIGSKQYFTFGSVESEIKKIAEIAGADELAIIDNEEMLKRSEFIENPRSIISYSVYSTDEELLKDIGRELKKFLNSKGYEAVILLLEITDLTLEQEYLAASIITDAKLNPDY